MDDSRIDLAKYRLAQAKQCIISAEKLYEIEDYKGAANRSYYSVFHSIRSVLALEKVDFKKHSAVISYFRKTYIKTGIFDVRLSDIISEAFDIRSDSDYDDFYIVSKKDIEEQIENVKYFYNEIEKYLEGAVKKPNLLD